MESVLAWFLITVLFYWALIRLFAKIVNEKEARKNGAR